MRTMKLLFVTLAAILAASAGTDALAQWKWRDANGVVQYSDRAPPSGVAAKDILERPSDRYVRQTAAATPSPAASSAAAPRVDPELEANRRKLEQDRDAKESAARKVEEQRLAESRAENCKRARGQLRSLEDGMRLVRVNEKGEREVLDDKGRADEITRARSVISEQCKS